MSSYSTNEFKAGLKVIMDGAPCSILENEYVKPGKGQAFNRIKYRNLKTGRVGEKTLKSGDTVEAADIIEIQVQYLYNDGTTWNFMDIESFEQYTLDSNTLGDAKFWIKEQDDCSLILWNQFPLHIEPQNFVHLKVTDTDPGLKGDTSGGGSKHATLETGATIKVPLFIQIGEVIKVDTRIKAYVSRAK